jgi:hypothetical protein
VIGSFLASQESFWGFHEKFLERYTRMPPDALSEADRGGWNEVYSWVLTAVPDPVPAEDGARGVIGEAELKRRLERHRLLAAPR